MIIDTLYKRMRYFPLDTLSRNGESGSIITHIEDSVDVDGSIMTGASIDAFLFSRDVVFPRAAYNYTALIAFNHEPQELQQYDYFATRYVTSQVAATHFEVTLELLQRYYVPFTPEK
jgi:hypothetical protein